MYDTIETDDYCVKTMVDILLCDRHTTYEGMLESPFEPMEIHQAIRIGGLGKAPGNDGIGGEVYSHKWNVIRDDFCDTLKQMLWAGHITHNRKGGVKICLPKQ